MTMKMYDVHNPAKAAQATHNGAEIPKGGSATYIHVPAGETKKNVELSERVVQDIRDRKVKNSLVFTEVKAPNIPLSSKTKENV